MDKLSSFSIKEKISSSLDDELSQDDVEVLVDNLLDSFSIEKNASEPSQNWQMMHLLSDSCKSYNNRQETSHHVVIFQAKDISLQISKCISDEPEYNFVNHSIMSKIDNIADTLPPHQMTIDKQFLNPFKYLMAGVGIVVSLVLVASNILFMQNNTSLYNQTNIASGKKINNHKTPSVDTIIAPVVVQVVTQNLSVDNLAIANTVEGHTDLNNTNYNNNELNHVIVNTKLAEDDSKSSLTQKLLLKKSP